MMEKKQDYHKIIAQTTAETPEIFRCIYISPDKKYVFVSLEGFAATKGEILSAVTEHAQGKGPQILFIDAHYYIDADWFLRNTPVGEERYEVLRKIKNDILAFVESGQNAPVSTETKSLDQCQ